MIKYIYLSLVFVTASLFFTSSAFCEEEKYYEPMIDVTAKAGVHRSLATLNLMMPLKQTKDVLLLADLRTVLDDYENSEGNIGIAYRQVLHLEKRDLITGTYVFYDRRHSQFDNYFSQVTAGTELLGESWAGRANFYLPLTNEKLIFDEPDTARLTPEGFVLVNPNRAVEKGLRGFDLELGKRVPFLEESWVHAAYYKFGLGDNNVSLNGARLRAHTQITDWLRVGVETSYDNIRGSNHFAEVRFRIPIGGIKKAKNRPQKHGIYRYMMEPIVRDIDIVTNVVLAAAAPAKTPGGKPELYVFVDNSVPAGGDGTPGDPFNNLTEAVAAVGKDNTIYVRQGDGTTTNMDSGITLDQLNLRFIGSGVDLTTRDDILVESATSTPHITHTAGDAVTVADDGIEVAGFSIDNPAFDGVFVLDYDAANIHDNTISGAGNNGINAAYTSNKNYNLTVTDNITSGNTRKGIYLRSYNGADLTATVTDNTANSNTQDGIQLEAGGANSTINVTMDGNTTNSNGNNAGLYAIMAGSADLTLNLSNHTASNNTINGVFALVGGTGTHTIVADNITADSNSQNGIKIDVQDSATTTATLTNTATDSNTRDGMVIIGRDGTDLTISVTGHSSTGNGHQGVDITTDGTLTAVLDTITSSTSNDGLKLQATNAGVLDITLLNSIFDSNTNAGVSIDGKNTASLSVQIDGTTVSNSGTNSLLLLDTTTGGYDIDFGGGALGSLGQNRIFGGGTFDVLGNLNGTAVFAQSNWWGVATGLAPGNVSLISGGSIDSSNFLVSDPGP